MLSPRCEKDPGRMTFPVAPQTIQQIDVPLGPAAYRIAIAARCPQGFGPFIHDSLQHSWAGRSCRLALLVADTNTRHLAEALQQPLLTLGIEPTLHLVPPGETSKSLAEAQRLWHTLADIKADRHTAVIAVGGGVVGDLAGFVAATYARGLPLVMVPTTLLAMVDSAVGGKVGINLPQAKNIVGAFHQPSAVWIDTDALATLPPREYRCGLAEVVKYGVILDADFFDTLERDVEPILAHNPQTLIAVIARCCALKAEVVAQDQREQRDIRAVLNFGHTIGHAIEAVAGYGGRYQHGEAVAIGMVLESKLAVRLGWIEPAVTHRVARLLQRLGLPATLDALDPASLLEAMSRDKKNQGGAIRFVLPTRIGSVSVTAAPTRELVSEILSTP
jgi:3-dehydroquinate synthase